MRQRFICITISLVVGLLLLDGPFFSQTPTEQTKPLLLGIHVQPRVILASAGQC